MLVYMNRPLIYISKKRRPRQHPSLLSVDIQVAGPHSSNILPLPLSQVTKTCLVKEEERSKNKGKYKFGHIFDKNFKKKKKFTKCFQKRESFAERLSKVGCEVSKKGIIG